MRILFAVVAACFFFGGIYSFLTGASLLAAVCFIGFVVSALASNGLERLRRQVADAPVTPARRPSAPGGRTLISGDPDIAAHLAAQKRRGE